MPAVRIWASGAAIVTAFMYSQAIAQSGPNRNPNSGTTSPTTITRPPASAANPLPSGNPPPAPSIDTNPDVGRSQQYTPPRATTK